MLIPTAGSLADEAKDADSQSARAHFSRALVVDSTSIPRLWPVDVALGAANERAGICACRKGGFAFGRWQLTGCWRCCGL